MVCELCRFVITTERQWTWRSVSSIFFSGYSQSACCIHRRYCMAERRYEISLWLLKKSANEWSIFSNTRKLVIFSLVCSIWNLWIFKYRKCSIRHPLSNKPPPSNNPPFFQGKKVNKPPSLLGPPPTPNYSPLINDRLYYAPINVMAAGGRTGHGVGIWLSLLTLGEGIWLILFSQGRGYLNLSSPEVETFDCRLERKDWERTYVSCFRASGMRCTV